MKSTLLKLVCCIVGTAVVTLFTIGCQRTNYPAARVAEPADAPPYTVEADPNKGP